MQERRIGHICKHFGKKGGNKDDIGIRCVNISCVFCCGHKKMTMKVIGSRKSGAKHAEDDFFRFFFFLKKVVMELFVSKLLTVFGIYLISVTIHYIS